MAAVIPPKTLEAEGLKEGDEVVLEIRRARPPREVFGLVANDPLKAQAVKDAIRRQDRE